MKIPLVSVCMITYNHEKYIAQAIEGVLMQEGDFRIELIITDDNSPDTTASIVNNIIQNHKNGKWIKYVRHERNLGMNQNFMYALKECKGQYIALCEGDDYWIDKSKLQKQILFLEGNPEYVACFTNAMVLDESDRSEKKYVKYPLSEKIDFETVISKSGGIYPTASMVFLNQALEVPEFLLNTNAADWALSLLLASKGNIGYLDYKTCVYRKHPGGAFTSIEKNMALRRKMNTNSIEFLQELDQYLNYTKSRAIKKKISQLAKMVIIRTANNKFSKENMVYFKKLNFIDFLSLVKHSLI